MIEIPEGWNVDRDVKPIPDRRFDFNYWHEDHDGSDGGDGLAGTASSVEDAVEQIKEIEKDLRDQLEQATGCSMDGLDKLSIRGDS